ncbi:hypothetical protein HD600_001195 [Microbacterium ginsengiterrae]|uniref:Uncharacterized protein n=1 Tax=Microbacterium ginsengiterrae TaxID=546115 RepID=A0A7W9CBW6_9MICO|nr:hypothetical protein [Microbacterium ginsengiterrae]
MNSQTALPSLDGRTFRMTSSTTSVVDPDAPSVFHYFEQDGAVWGDYSGDTVTFGRFIGTRSGDTISIHFVHVLADGGAVVTGSGDSEIEQDENGLRLVEHYEMHGAPQLSVCVEVVD